MLSQQIETFSALLALCARNSPVTGEYPSQRPVTRSLMYLMICAWTNGWVNNRNAGDLRRHRAHYDITVMMFLYALNFVSVAVLATVTLQLFAKWALIPRGDFWRDVIE